jgi:hypothetical protein
MRTPAHVPRRYSAAQRDVMTLGTKAIGMVTDLLGKTSISSALVPPIEHSVPMAT